LTGIDYITASKLLLNTIRKYIRSIKCDCIALSGGIDTSTIALAARLENMKLRGILVYYNKSIPRDLYYAIHVSRKLGIDLHVTSINDYYIKQKAPLIIKCVENRDYIELRNDIVFLKVLEEAKRLHCKCILTGDGGDELFAGYSFTKTLNTNQLRESIIRLGVRGRYPTLELAECIGVEAYAPFLADEVVETILKTPLEYIRGLNLEGKAILRRILEEYGLYIASTRKKTPAEQGAGTDILDKNLLEEITGLELEALHY
jgi:asparagine synthase (glutamine-hydrolysing)